MATYEQLVDAARRADAAGDGPAAKRFLELAKEGRASQTSLTEQVGTGTSEGIANMIGLPVDAVTGGLNMLGAGIEKPFGGSESIRGLLDPFMSDVEPQTMGQRIGRRVGQDVGAGAVAAPVAGVASLGGAALNAGADAASGLAGGLTSEVTDNPAINAIVSLLAGTGVAAGPYMARPGPQAPSNAALRSQEDALWQQVRDSGTRLSPTGSQALKGDVSAKAFDMRMKPSLHGPEATAAVDEVWSLPDRPTLWEVEEARRFIGENTPSMPDKKSTARVTVGLKEAIDRFMDRVPGSETAKEARDVSRRRIASEKLDLSIDKAERRAARSGSGGNAINTSRQNIDALLNSPKQASTFTKAEREIMDTIVRGDRATNTARKVGGLSPDKGALPLAGNVAAMTAGVMSGDPVTALATITPGAVGFFAKKIGEDLTDAQIKRLSETIRNGGVPVPGKAMTAGEKAVLTALLSTQLANGAEH